MKHMPDFSMEKCEEVANTLKTISHPHRLMILCQLIEGPKTVGELEDISGASQSSVSQYLSRLKTEGLVSSEREGQFISYEIASPELKKLIKSLHTIFCKS
jgi:DNA-binding transcriptional ArsR family regulator